MAVVAGGLVVAACGYGVLTRLDADSGVAVIVTGTVVMAAGITLVMTTTSDLVIATAPADRAGSVSGLSQTATEFGGAFGIAVLGSIGTAVYRHDMARDLPDGLPPGAATAARDTLGGAVDTARHLPTETGADLLATARDAFAHGLRVASWTTAGLLLTMAVVSLLLLRHTVRGGDADGGGAPGRGPETGRPNGRPGSKRRRGPGKRAVRRPCGRRAVRPQPGRARLSETGGPPRVGVGRP
ncbi:hypothetical protein ACQEVS_32515 [Streptomyces sp. CA-181903]|uniref:hypothetical protein n=1 Tax=Streptomyces sp. CA-181903 TaxID=3240055 RepID=UPI003D9024A6